ncbi:transposase [Streptomyces sp. FXJ1.4098]|nr:transposase [Streptomyces sp. FXJ1.4098]
MSGLREVAEPFVTSGPAGVAIRTRIKHLTAQDEKVLALVGAHLGSLASRDLKTRCADSLKHSADRWAARKRELTPVSSARWAGAITKASHDQWALARRCQLAHIQSLEAGVAMIAHRLAQPVGAKGSKGSKNAAGGYRSRQEWFVKARRLHVLQDRLERERADREAGTVHVVRGGKRLARTRHHLDAAGLTEAQWREQWEAERWFLQADGEYGKRYGNETIRITSDGWLSIKLPAALKDLANAPHSRYIFTAPVRFAHRGIEWADRVEANRAVAYRIHYETGRNRWYVTASWQIPPRVTIPLEAALTQGVIAVDTNADHLAAWRLDVHGNPIGNPRRFFYDLSGTADHRDAQVRHALTRLLHWAKDCGVAAIAIEDLDFAAEKTREKHGRRKRFRQLISGMPTSRLRARLSSMTDATGITIIAVDPAYTSKWGAQHWQKPLTTKTRKTTRHDAAAVAIGRRAQGHPIRRRTAPPHTTRAIMRGIGPPRPDRTSRARGTPPRIPGPRTRSVRAGCEANTGNQNAQHRSGRSAEHEPWYQDSLPLSP